MKTLLILSCALSALALDACNNTPGSSGSAFVRGDTSKLDAHADDEECLVLEGEVSVGDLRLRAGDFHVAARGSQHPRLESRPGALLLLSHALHR